MNVSQLARVTWSEVLKEGPYPLIRVLLPITAMTGAVTFGMVMLDRRAADYDKTEFITPAMALLGFLLFGVLVLLVAAAWRYVGEAATGVLLDTYRVSPQRSVVVLSKALVSALWGGLTALSSLAVAIGVLVATGPSHVTPTLLRPELIVGLPLVTAAWSMIALAFAAVVRRVIPALGGLVLWYALAEDFLKGLPGIGPMVRAVAPFSSGQMVLGLGDPVVGPERRWLAALALAGVCVVLLVVSIAVETRRDVRVGASA